MIYSHYAEVEGVTWEYCLSDDNNATILGANPVAGMIVIPGILDGHLVTSIGGWAFQDCDNLNSVTIPSSVTDIGFRAFGYCDSLVSINVDSGNMSFSSSDGILYDKTRGTLLCCPGGKTSVTIPSSVKSLGESAFSDSFSLVSINVDPANAVYSSSDGVLYDKSKKTLVRCPMRKASVTILSSVTSIGGCAFYDCRELSSVTIPLGVTSIGEDAFGECAGLTSVTIPSSVTSIGDFAFSNCRSLPSITIPSSVTSIGDGAFCCSGLTALTIPPGVTHLGGYLVEECVNLRSLTISMGVTHIVEEAFGDFCVECDKVSLTIPLSVTSIGKGAFYLPELPTAVYVYVSPGDTQRVKDLLASSGVDVSALQFVESSTAGEWDGEDCGGDCSPGDEGDGGGAGVKDPFDGNEKHVFNGLVRDKKKSPCGLIQVTTAKATKKGVKVSGFVMLEDGKKVTMKAVTVAVDKKQLNVSTTVGKLGSISLTIGGKGFAGTFGDKKVASEKLDEDAGVLKTTVKVTYLDAATGKLKTKNMTLGGITVGGDAVGTLSQKNSSTRAFQAETECDSCRPN